MSVADLFVTASRKKYRFATIRGEATLEQLWDMPLTSKDNFNLDAVARAINTSLKAETEESFVKPVSNAARQVELSNKLDLVKHVIAVKLDEKAKVEKRVANAEERRRLIEALANRENEELSKASKEEIEKRLAALNDD